MTPSNVININLVDTNNNVAGSRVTSCEIAVMPKLITNSLQVTVPK